VESVHLFYSWQSDRPGKVCRDFIWGALEVAAAKIEADYGMLLALDRDTMGVAGTPPITDTILTKIRACDFFLADVTLVGRADENDSKLLPNPNVMTEYGFARALKPHGQLLLVMNTAFGLPSALPFDLQQMRHPTEYRASAALPNSQRRAARSRLGETLVPFLKLSIEEVVAARRSAQPASDQAERAKAALHDLDLITHRGDMPALVSKPCLRVRLVPFAALAEPSFDLALLKRLRPQFVPSGFASERRHDHTDAWQWASYDPPRPIHGRPNPEARWFVRVVDPGLLEASITVGYREDNDETIAISGHQTEARIVDAAIRLAHIAREIGLAGPALIAGALHGVSDVQIEGARSIGRCIGYPDVTLGQVMLPSLEAATAETLRPLLDRLWLLSGWEEGSPSFSGGNWAGAGYGGPYRL
jgi:hypothetical protein